MSTRPIAPGGLSDRHRREHLAIDASRRRSTRSVIEEATRHGFASLALPAIGAGAGSFDETKSFALIRDELSRLDYPGRVVLVRFWKV